MASATVDEIIVPTPPEVIHLSMTWEEATVLTALLARMSVDEYHRVVAATYPTAYAAVEKKDHLYHLYEALLSVGLSGHLEKNA